VEPSGYMLVMQGWTSGVRCYKRLPSGLGKMGKNGDQNPHLAEANKKSPVKSGIDTDPGTAMPTVNGKSGSTLRGAHAEKSKQWQQGSWLTSSAAKCNGAGSSWHENS